MKVVYLESVGHQPEVREIKSGDLGTLVKGYIECIRLDDHRDLWVNDEGLLHDEFTPTLALPNGTIIAGPVAIARYNMQGETLSVEDWEIEPLKKWLNNMKAKPGTVKPEPHIEITSWTKEK